MASAYCRTYFRYILRWLAESHRQDSITIEAAAAAAGRLPPLGFVVYGGVLRPMVLAKLRWVDGLAEIHHVILLPAADPSR